MSYQDINLTDRVEWNGDAQDYGYLPSTSSCQQAYMRMSSLELQIASHLHKTRNTKSMLLFLDIMIAFSKIKKEFSSFLDYNSL